MYTCAYLSHLNVTSIILAVRFISFDSAKANSCWVTIRVTAEMEQNNSLPTTSALYCLWHYTPTDHVYFVVARPGASILETSNLVSIRCPLSTFLKAVRQCFIMKCRLVFHDEERLACVSRTLSLSLLLSRWIAEENNVITILALSS